MEADPLATLRDIHLPDPISALPTAPGWWILALVAMSIIIAGMIGWRRHRKQTAIRRTALEAWQQIDPHSTTYLPAINRLLKRTALATYPTEQVSHLNGHAWLVFLDQTLGSNEFTTGCGQYLLDGPYRPTHPNHHWQALHQLVKRWINQHKAWAPPD